MSFKINIRQNFKFFYKTFEMNFGQQSFTTQSLITIHYTKLHSTKFHKLKLCITKLYCYLITLNSQNFTAQTSLHNNPQHKVHNTTQNSTSQNYTTQSQKYIKQNSTIIDIKLHHTAPQFIKLHYTKLLLDKLSFTLISTISPLFP